MAKLEPRVRALVVRSSSGFIKSVHDSEILLVNYRSAQHIWDLPGGHINIGEKPEIAVIREIQEETGIVAHIIRKIGSYERFRMLRTGVRLHYDVHVFLCYGDGIARPHDTKEVLKASWFQFLTDKELRKICSEATK